MHYLQTGAGPHMVMLHGLLGNQAVWHLRMVPLLRDRFRLTTYDLRGHGRSDAPPTGYTTGDMAKDLEGMLDALGIERAHLVGHSLGADICLYFTLLHPERVESLVLVEAGLPALVETRKRSEWEGWGYWARLLQEFTGIEVPRERWNDIDYMIRLSLEVPIIYGPASGMPRRKDTVLRLLESTTIVRDYEEIGELTIENLPRIKRPKLLIYDAQSPYLASFEVLRGRLADCQEMLLPASKYQHFGPLETPELLVGHMMNFFENRSATPMVSRQSA
jgi:pimeloyl-ACP methyl ester carboxylesterase